MKVSFIFLLMGALLMTRVASLEEEISVRRFLATCPSTCSACSSSTYCSKCKSGYCLKSGKCSSSNCSSSNKVTLRKPKDLRPEFSVAKRLIIIGITMLVSSLIFILIWVFCQAKMRKDKKKEIVRMREEIDLIIKGSKKDTK